MILLNPSKHRILFSAGLLLCLALAQANTLAQFHDADTTLASRFIAIAIQGDLRPAVSMFNSNRSSDPGAEDLRQRFEQRFVQDPQIGSMPSPAGPDMLDSVVTAYHAYWRSSLLRVNNRERDEQALVHALQNTASGLMPEQVANTVSPALLAGALLETKDVHYLETETPPFRDLFIWRQERVENHTVELTDGTRSVEVRFMDDFLVQGWKEFASLGLATTTGWVDQGRLYCVDWAYDTDSENFVVSYLKHETRHLVDLDRFPLMEPIELEYRAKLTELAYANHSLKRVLDDFAIKAANNPQSAHAMANLRVTRDLYRMLNGQEPPADWKGWGYVDTGKVNRAARELLARNTRDWDRGQAR